MVIKNCPKCGGEHWGSIECPYTDEQVAQMTGPCPICGSVEGCDHTVNERVEAARSRTHGQPE